MFEALRVHGEDGDMLQLVRRGESIHILLTHGSMHMRYQVSAQSLMDGLLLASGWSDWPSGRCPSCSRADGKLESSFCVAHRSEYALSMAGKKAERDETGG